MVLMVEFEKRTLMEMTLIHLKVSKTGTVTLVTVLFSLKFEPQ